MRDPHVVALHYRLETGPQLAFNDPEPVERENDSFTLRLANGELRLEMKDHFATADEARLEVDQYLRSWEIDTGLKYGPGALRFQFDRPDIEDRDPPPPESPEITPRSGTLNINVSDGAHVFLSDSVRLQMGLSIYPTPPDSFAASPDVVEMWGHYTNYREKVEPLSTMAFFCVTAFQRTEARNTVSEKVLSHLRYLATMVGDPQALRKRQDGQDLRPHTPAETAWMEAVVKRIIQRVGEWAADPTATWPQITMEDFP
jgi:hypothetical protein